jgi:transposase
LVKTFGIILDAGKGGTFVRQAEEKMPSDPIVGTVIETLLTAWKAVAAELRELDRNIEQMAHANPLHQALMTVPWGRRHHCGRVCGHD